MSRSILLACAVVLMAASASAYMTTDEINLPYGVKAQCNQSASNPDAGKTTVLSIADCYTCVNTVANQLADNRTHGCWDVCQNSAIIGSASEATACSACIQNEDTTVEGCKACLLLPDGDYQACINDIEAPAPTGLPWYRNTEYELAVAKCYTLPAGSTDGTVRAKCLACINSATALPQSQGGFMTPEETPTVPDGRPNDFGACYWLFNQTWNLVNDIADAQGVYGLCNTAKNQWGKANSLSAHDCGFCMASASANPSDFGPDPAGNHWTVHREPYCAQLCIAQSNTSDIANDCVTCVEGSDANLPKSPSSCGFCMVDSFTADQRSACFSCLAADGVNYNSATSNYDWACGQCAAQTNQVLQDLCFTCIQSQTGYADGQIDPSTESSICQCVDLTFNDFYINDYVTGLERACLANYNRGVNGTADYINEAPNWGWPAAGTSSSSSTNDDYPCIKCIADASQNNQYACHEVCQDNSLIADSVAGGKCSDCVTNKINTGADCKACLVASSDDGKRDHCYTCIADVGKATPSDAANYISACTTCSEFSSTTVSNSCYDCLANTYPSATYVQAWDCINAVKNGTYPATP